MNASTHHPDGTRKSQGNAFDPSCPIPFAPTWSEKPKGRPKSQPPVVRLPGTVTLDINGRRNVPLTPKRTNNIHIGGGRTVDQTMKQLRPAI